MNVIRKAIVLVAALMFATFAAPSFGDTPNKHVILDTQLTAPKVVKVTLSNDNPSGSSAQISSYIVSLSSLTGLTIVSAVADGASSTAFGGTVAFTSTSFSVNNLSPNLKAGNPGDSYVVFVTVAGCGEGNKWSAQAWTGSGFTGGTYNDDHKGNENTDIVCGSADCSATEVTFQQPYGTVRLAAGKYTQEGDSCAASDYYITDTISLAGSGVAKFNVLQSDLAFRYSIFDPSNTTPINWTTTSQVAWACDPTNDSSCWVLAEPCALPTNQALITHAEPYLPWPYTKLVADGGKTIQVDPSAFDASNPVPTQVPFPIFVESERMVVTKIQSKTNTWTVQRCTWGTCTTVPTHAPGLNVMSTVLPQFTSQYKPAGASASYVVGTPAQVCYVGNQLIQSFDVWGKP